MDQRLIEKEDPPDPNLKILQRNLAASEHLNSRSFELSRVLRVSKDRILKSLIHGDETAVYRNDSVKCAEKEIRVRGFAEERKVSLRQRFRERFYFMEMGPTTVGRN
uniref:Uncharacterized protein n=1 Tax=Vespula pensylvanica TaxID=30213 RepID=A0A834PC30_VESPE|nr:hypothetical protein H0235_003476 [Vespula pensylvanica]